MYLNTDILDSYIATIDGGVSDSATVIETKSSQKAAGMSANVGAVSGNFGGGKNGSEEVKRDVRISPPAKFNKIYEYLQKNDQGKY